MTLHHPPPPTIQGVPKKMRLGFCLISQQPSIGFSNRFFLLKTEIHTQILHTKPFLFDFMGRRYLRDKMRFLTGLNVINSNFSDFCPSGILKHDKNEHKWKCFHPVWTTYDISGYPGGYQWHSLPFRGSVWDLRVPTVLSGTLRTSIEFNLSVSEPHFV